MMNASARYLLDVEEHSEGKLVSNVFKSEELLSILKNSENK